MLDNREWLHGRAASVGNGGREKLASSLPYIVVAVLSLLVTHFVVQRVGVHFFTVGLVLLFFGSVYYVLSFRNLLLPFSVFVLAVGGFRYIWTFTVPGLPDLSIDRLALIWLLVVWMIRSVAMRTPLRAPIFLDVVILTHGAYLFISLIVHDMNAFSLWTRSYLVPYIAYFLAKNIVTSIRSIRRILIMLVVINIYYAITSIGEKFDIKMMVWPHAILTLETMWLGRSLGPFGHAPLFGTVQGMILPIYLYLIVTAGSRAGRLFWYVPLFLGLVGLYFTYTRGAWLVGIFSLATTLVLNRRQYVKISVPAMVIMPLLAVFVLGLGSDKFMKDRVDDDNTIMARLGATITATRAWRDYPIFGVGFFKYKNVRERYVGPIELPIYGSVKLANFRNTSIHDIYLGPLAESGLVGMGLQVLIYFLALKAFLKQLRNRRLPEHYRVLILPVLGGMCVGYMVGGLSIDYRFFSVVGAIFYIAIGIVYGYTGSEDVREAPKLAAGK